MDTARLLLSYFNECVSKHLARRLLNYKYHTSIHNYTERFSFWYTVEFLGGPVPSSEGCGHHGTTSYASSIQRNCGKPQAQVRSLYQQCAGVSTAGYYTIYLRLPVLFC
jgi:hypothetical protein